MAVLLSSSAIIYLFWSSVSHGIRVLLKVDRCVSLVGSSFPLGRILGGAIRGRLCLHFPTWQRINHLLLGTVVTSGGIVALLVEVIRYAANDFVIFDTLPTELVEFVKTSLANGAQRRRNTIEWGNLWKNVKEFG